MNTQPDQKKTTQNKLDATILFVDDEKNILSSLKRLFRPLIENIMVAESGAEGLTMLEQAKVDIVVSDMRMPEMDGAEFLKQVAEKYPDTIRILLTGYADITSTIDAINKGSIYRYISKPWEDNDIRLTIQHALKSKFLEKERIRLQALTKSQNIELKELNENLEERVKARTEEVRQTMGQLQVAHTTLKNNYLATIKVFSNIIELREGGESELTQNISDMSHKIAKEIGMSDDNAQQLTYACLLRNIGKIGLPDNLITRPFNSLSSEEKTTFIMHPDIGQGILMSLDYLQRASTIMRHQHEQYDGKGYPDNLEEKNIPIGARILTLTSDYYAYQAGLLSASRLSESETITHIKQNSGVLYDPELVDILIKLGGVASGTGKGVGISKTSPEGQQKDAKEIMLDTINISEGMVMARDLKLSNGIVLLPKGHALTKNVILRLRKMENSVNEKMVFYIVGKK